jgi:hypothetical protein
MCHTWAFDTYSARFLLKNFLLKTRNWGSNISTKTSRVVRKFLLQIHWMIRNKMYESDFLWEHFHFFLSIVQKSCNSLICTYPSYDCNRWVRVHITIIQYHKVNDFRKYTYQERREMKLFYVELLNPTAGRCPQRISYTHIPSHLSTCVNWCIRILFVIFNVLKKSG